MAEFITRYRLDAGQRESALRCLRRAQEAANQYLTRKRQEFEALEEKRDAGKLTAKQTQEQFAKLRRPVDDLFEDQLKPCLEKIPTRRQKVAVAALKKREAGQHRSLPESMPGQRRTPP